MELLIVAQGNPVQLADKVQEFIENMNSKSVRNTVHFRIDRMIHRPFGAERFEDQSKAQNK